MDGIDDDYVSDIVFQRSVSEQFSAELAIGPALALVVGQMPSSGFRKTLLSVAMVVLVLTSIFRFLAFTDRFANQERVSRLTVRPLQLSAIICLAKVVEFATTQFSVFVPYIGAVGLSVLVTALGTILFIYVYESFFQTYRFSWGVLYYVKAISITRSIDVDLSDVDAVTDVITSGNSLQKSMKIAISILLVQVLRAVYVSVAYFLLRDSIPSEEEDDPYIDELRMWVDAHREQKPISDRTSIGFAFAISGIVVLPVYFVLSWTLSWILGPILTVLGVVIVMRLLEHVVNVTYISFGGLRYNQILTTNVKSVVLDGFYTLVVWIILVNSAEPFSLLPT